MSIDEICWSIQNALMRRAELALAEYTFGGIMDDHDLRRIDIDENKIGSGIDLQCLNCGSIFRSTSLAMALALIDCAEERRNREYVLGKSAPMMVSLRSEKYVTPSAGH